MVAGLSPCQQPFAALFWPLSCRKASRDLKRPFGTSPLPSAGCPQHHLRSTHIVCGQHLLWARPLVKLFSPPRSPDHVAPELSPALWDHSPIHGDVVGLGSTQKQDIKSSKPNTRSSTGSPKAQPKQGGSLNIVLGPGGEGVWVAGTPGGAGWGDEPTSPALYLVSSAFVLYPQPCVPDRTPCPQPSVRHPQPCVPCPQPCVLCSQPSVPCPWDYIPCP